MEFPLRRYLVAGVVLLLAAACDSSNPPPGESQALDDAARRYVRLALELDEYDPDYVDAYLGPSEWAEDAQSNLRSRDVLAADIAKLLADLQSMTPADVQLAARHKALLIDVRGMDTRARMVNGEKFSFDEEARRIYGVTVPEFDFAEFDRALVDIDALIPGEGDLASRVDAFRNSFTIPEATREAVIANAIDECRRRTLLHIQLPPDESYTLEYVRNQSWGGYNWYQGGNRSRMQINVDFPPKIGAAISLGCHEGYPGHHVWNVLVENRLLKEKAWIEYVVFPLFSAKGLIGEGSANYGVDLAFPGNEKIAYEREVLFPMAGLDLDAVETLERLGELTRRLAYAQVATARRYLDGEISREEAIEERRRYGLISPARAEQSVRFIEQYRSYVLNYSLGRDIVRDYIEAQSADAGGRWQAFERMLATMPTVAEMVAGAAAISDEAAVLAAEDEWIQAEIDGDESTLRRVLADEFRANQSNGKTGSKDGLIKSVLGADMTDQQITERSVVVSGDTAVVFGTAELFFAGEEGETSSLLRYTTTWIRRDGQWRAIALHMSGRARPD